MNDWTYANLRPELTRDSRTNELRGLIDAFDDPRLKSFLQKRLDDHLASSYGYSATPISDYTMQGMRDAQSEWINGIQYQKNNPYEAIDRNRLQDYRILGVEGGPERARFAADYWGQNGNMDLSNRIADVYPEVDRYVAPEAPLGRGDKTVKRHVNNNNYWDSTNQWDDNVIRGGLQNFDPEYESDFRETGTIEGAEPVNNQVYIPPKENPNGSGINIPGGAKSASAVGNVNPDEVNMLINMLQTNPDGMSYSDLERAVLVGDSLPYGRENGRAKVILAGANEEIRKRRRAEETEKMRLELNRRTDANAKRQKDEQTKVAAQTAETERRRYTNQGTFGRY